MSFVTITQLFGGVGLFLFAISLISDSLQKAAGERLRNLIGMFTKSPWKGVLLGAGVTMLIQSSTATTVMTVSFVEAGIMNLMQAIGVIMGANIGTTVTGQILAFRVTDYLYLFIISGTIFFFISAKYKHIGSGLFGFGLLFLGMQTMQNAMTFLQDQQEIFLNLAQYPILSVLAGAVLTILIQSSAATVGMTIALGTQGLIPLEAAIPIILGDNIGTTITAVFAAINTGRTARQACMAHVLFNVIGVCIFLPLTAWYADLIRLTSESIGHQIANAHSLFNVFNTIIFLPFVPLFAKFIQKIIPDIPKDDGDLSYLDPILIERTPVIAVNAVSRECSHLGSIVLSMLEKTEALFFDEKEDNRDLIAKLELKVDNIEEAIQNYAHAILRKGIIEEDSEFLKALVNTSGELERMADKCLRIVAFKEHLNKRGQKFSQEAMEEAHALFSEAQNSVKYSLEFYEKDMADISIEKLDALTIGVRKAENQLRSSHADRVGKGICTPEAGLIFIDLLGAIEQIAYRAKKVGDTMITARI